MADVLQTGSDWLNSVRRSHASQSVTYHRGAQSVSLSAGIGQTGFSIVNEDGVVVEEESRDYLIQVADLVIAGSPVEPARGDRIKETRSGVVHIYEVLAPGGGPVFKLSDRYGKVYRVHTKFMGTE